jgi:hypothetical protein
MIKKVRTRIIVLVLLALVGRLSRFWSQEAFPASIFGSQAGPPA